MQKELLKIGEMAKLNHISTQTLRLYAKNKLLEPEYLDKNTGYRYYTIAQCAKLDLIKVLKSCRLSLEQIKQIFLLSSETSLIKILENQIGRLSNEIYNLTVSRNNLLRIEKNLKVLNSLPPLGHIFFEYIPERIIDVQETQYDFFAQGHAGYEKMLRHMQNYLHQNKLPPSYFVNIGTIMDRDHFLKCDYCSYKVFIFVDELYPQRESLQTIPANTYISIVSNDTSLEPEFARELYREIQKQNMTPCDDYICEVLSQFPMENIDQIIYKIQIPVKKA
ncbi:MAG: MerR family transcriptional regulator [Saccharofermentanales bacterium]|jgi:DNA-binding transcriptional MerR regulator